MFRYSFCFVFLVLISSGCRKNDITKSGEATIYGFVEFTGNLGASSFSNQRVPNAIIYLKYDATKFPGGYLGQYDTTINADGLGSFSIANMCEGKYYLYAVSPYMVGPASYTLAGGVQVNIDHRKSNLNYDIAVSQ